MRQKGQKGRKKHVNKEYYINRLSDTRTDIYLLHTKSQISRLEAYEFMFI